MLRISGNDFVIKNNFIKTLQLRDEVIYRVDDPVNIINECKKQKFKADVLTFVQIPPDVIPKYDYYKSWDNIAVIPVVNYDYWLNYQVSKNTRKMMKKLEEGEVSVELKPFDDELIRGMMEIFNETPIRRGRPYSYFGFSKDKVFEGWKPDLDRSDFVVAYLNGEMIGFIKLIYSDSIARASGTVAKLAYRQYAPMSALLKKCFELCVEKGIPYLMYGKYDYGTSGDDQLVNFKQHNGFVRIDIPRYYVPLSIKGKIALALRLHEGIRRFIPIKLLRILVGVKTKLVLRKNRKRQ